MIDVQQNTFDKLEDELKRLRDSLSTKREEEDELKAELKERIPRGQLDDLNQQRKAQMKIP